jgi:signal transduction histidine kinase
MMRKGIPSPLWRYGVAVIAGALALLLTRLLWSVINPSGSPLFLAAVMVSAWYGGLGPGLLATALSTVTIDSFFVPLPRTQIPVAEQFLRLGVFALVAFLISSLTVARKRAAAPLHSAHDELETQVQQRTTELAQANERLRAELSEHRRTEEEVAVRTRQQATVADLGQRALAGGSLAAFLDTAVTVVAHTLGVEYCMVLELLADGKTLLLRAGVGWKDGTVGHMTVSGGANSQAGYTLLANEPVIVEDLGTERRFSGSSLLHEHGVVSGISVIIVGQDRPFGILGAHATRRRTFSPDDVYFLHAVANVLAGTIRRTRAEQDKHQLLYDLGERVKELTVLHGAARLLQNEQTPTAELLHEIAALLPPAWQHPERTAARVVFDGVAYATPHFSPTPWIQQAAFTTPSGKQGVVEVAYLEEQPNAVEGPFLAEERSLLDSVAELLQSYFERAEAKVQVAQVTQELVRRNEELWRLQREMGRVEPLAALGRVTGTIAHELGTPLNSVLGYSQLLAQEDLPESARESVEIIEAQAQRMIGIIQHYLSRSRGSLPRHRQVNINELVRETLALLTSVFQQHQVQVATALAESLPLLSGDGASLQRVLINLLNNAVDAIDEGGTVTVAARVSAPPEAPRPGVAIEITDTGRGIPPELLPSIFDLFVTTKAPGKGTGLGLMVCQEIIKSHGGTIDIDSQIGQGTCVRIFLPTADEVSDAAPVKRQV